MKNKEGKTGPVQGGYQWEGRRINGEGEGR
jgi:hypothetical protein